ncbi:hypothetical protein UlMin_027924 [Ulmus minor]
MTESNQQIENISCLYFDQLIPAFYSEHPFQPEHIYFVLPSSMLQHSLSGSDMAYLAIKASTAIQNYNTNSSNSNNSHCHKTRRRTTRSSNFSTFIRCRSVRKLQRYTSKRPKMVVRSFRLQLTTI